MKNLYYILERNATQKHKMKIELTVNFYVFQGIKEYANVEIIHANVD